MARKTILCNFCDGPFDGQLFSWGCLGFFKKKRIVPKNEQNIFLIFMCFIVALKYFFSQIFEKPKRKM